MDIEAHSRVMARALASVDTTPDREAEAQLAASPGVRGIFDTPTGFGYLWKTACHEAGHAVAAHRWGATIDEVSISKNGASYCKWHYEKDDFAGRIGHIVSALSGHVAEAYAVDGVSLVAEVLRASYDYWNAARRLFSLNADFPAQYLDHNTVANLAAAGVSQAWPDIYTLATALGGQGKLSGDEVRTILRVEQST